MVSRGSMYIQRLGGMLGATEDPAVQRLMDAMHERALAPQETLFAAGEHSNSIYFVVNGCLAISIAGRNGREVMLDMLRAGDIAGETALVEDGVRRRSVFALEPSIVVGISREDFEVLMQQSRAFATAVTRLMAERILAHERLIQRLTSQSVSSRLAQLLLDLLARQAGNSVLKLHLTHNQIAQLVSTSRETVSALLSRFVKLGFIQYDRASITILNEAGLGECARSERYVSAR